MAYTIVMGLLDRLRWGSKKSALALLLETNTRVRCRKPDAEEFLYETTDPSALHELEAALRTEPESIGHCMCLGTLVFEIERPAAVPVKVTLHHGESLRWDGAVGNVNLLDRDRLMNWLSARGMTFVRERYEADQRKAERMRDEASRWFAAMPKSLRPFFDDMRNTPRFGAHPAWTAAIAREFPDPVKRAAVLIELFGSGLGPWSGFAIWESVPGYLLLDVPLDVLLEAVGSASDVRVLEGAARLFSSWDFARTRAADLPRLPPELRRLLLEHVETTPGNSDRRARARKALG